MMAEVIFMRFLIKSIILSDVDIKLSQIKLKRQLNDSLMHVLCCITFKVAIWVDGKENKSWFIMCPPFPWGAGVWVVGLTNTLWENAEGLTEWTGRKGQPTPHWWINLMDGLLATCPSCFRSFRMSMLATFLFLIYYSACLTTLLLAMLKCVNVSNILRELDMDLHPFVKMLN